MTDRKVLGVQTRRGSSYKDGKYGPFKRVTVKGKKKTDFYPLEDMPPEESII